MATIKRYVCPACGPFEVVHSTELTNTHCHMCGAPVLELNNLIIGACLHGQALHYRYPCSQCEADRVVRQVHDDLIAGYTSENGLLIMLRKHVEDLVIALTRRLNQGT